MEHEMKSIEVEKSAHNRGRFLWEETMKRIVKTVPGNGTLYAVSDEN